MKLTRRRILGIGAIVAVKGAAELLGSTEEDGSNTTTQTKDPNNLNEFSSSTTTASPTESDLTTTESDNLDDFVTELPKPVIQEYFQTEPQLVSVDQELQSGKDEFTAVVQNTGHAGDVVVKLYWVTDSNTPITPERTQSLYFNADERREVSMTAEPPADLDEYQFTASTGTRGAIIRNMGPAGNVHVRLVGSLIKDSDALLDEKTLFMKEKETKEVSFDGDHPMAGNKWEIEVEVEE